MIPHSPAPLKLLAAAAAFALAFASASAAENANSLAARGPAINGKTVSVSVAYLLPFNPGVTLPGYRIALAVTADTRVHGFGGVIPVVMTDQQAPSQFRRYGTSPDYGVQYLPAYRTMRAVVRYAADAKGSQFDYLDITGKDSGLPEAISKAVVAAENQGALQDAKKIAAQMEAAAKVTYTRFSPIR